MTSPITNLRLAVLCAACALAAGSLRPVPAQQPSSTASPAQRPAATGHGNITSPETLESLNLTQEQRDKIKAIREDSEKQIEDVQKDATLTEAKKATKLRKIKSTTRAQIFAVLTPEQQKQWTEQQREARQSRKGAAHQE
jgi:Spy/CpxP family protein refolding chaperone